MFWGYLQKKKWHICGYAVLTMIGSALLAGFTLLIAPVFDDVKKGNYSGVIVRLGIMFLWYVGMRLLNYYTELMGVGIINSVRKNIKNDLFRSVMNKRISAFTDRDAGEYISEFTNDITVIENKFLIPCNEALTYLIQIATACMAIYTIDYRMTIVIAAGTAISLGTPLFMTRYTTSRMSRYLRRFDHFVQFLKDSFGAYFTFKNYAVEGKVIYNFNTENSRVEKDKLSAEMAIIFVNSIVGRLAWAVEILVVLIGMLGMLRGTLSAGSVIAAYMLAGSLGIPLQSLGNRISMIRSVKSIEEKFMTLHQQRDEVNPSHNDGLAEEKFSIRVENVSLSIKNSPVLQDVSVTFEPGGKYLIIGRNGSGKSTLAKLLKGSYQDYTGRILLGGRDLESPEGAMLNKRISYSNETVSLLSDTIRNNILLYRDIPEERLQKALSMAALDLPIQRMVGDGGRFLSSGERRKLEIVRALVENPRVIILDEVVSTLDIETAYEIERLVLSLKDQTVIMISNAFSGQLLEKYDEIILMDKGRIVGRGKHPVLLDESPEYREMFEIRCGGLSEGGSLWQ